MRLLVEARTRLVFCHGALQTSLEMSMSGIGAGKVGNISIRGIRGISLSMGMGRRGSRISLGSSWFDQLVVVAALGSNISFVNASR